ncbi:MAG: hypothetical protein VX815_13490 [Gemmatimonadota bacterium]|nr:hypothetical protein [Gemmatimonadota bacterium]
MVLLAGSGPLVRSFLALRSVDTGFDPDRLLTAALELPMDRYPDDVGREQGDEREVVGVVADVATSALQEGVEGAMYYPYHQPASSSMPLAVRTSGEAASVTATVRGIVRDLAPALLAALGMYSMLA